MAMFNGIFGKKSLYIPTCSFLITLLFARYHVIVVKLDLINAYFHLILILSSQATNTHISERPYSKTFSNCSENTILKKCLYHTPPPHISMLTINIRNCRMHKINKVGHYWS